MNQTNLTVQVTVSSRIDLQGPLSEEVEKYLREQLTFINPEYKLAEKQGRSTRGVPVQLCFFKRKASNHFQIPRGFAANLTRILRYFQVPYQVEDQTLVFPEESFRFRGKLHTFQKQAVEAVLSRRFGVLNSPTGSGKTVMSLAVLAARKQPTLIICHTKELLYQWQERAMEFLGLHQDEIGLVGDGHMELNKSLTIAIINSLYKCADQLAPRIGCLVVDECHRVPSRTFTEAVEKFASRFMLGLTATAYRRDRLTKLIYFYLGDRVYDISPQALQKVNKIMTAQLVVRHTYFTTELDPSSEYQAVISEIVHNHARNQLIVRDVITEAKSNKGVLLVLSERKNHCEILHQLLMEQGMVAELLTGTTTKKKRESIVRELEQGIIKILVATGGLIGEGFDCSRLSCLFITIPIKFTGRVTQYIGRILRTAENKTQPKIYDYLDNSPVLQNSFASRCYAYQQMGVEIPQSETGE